MLLPIFIGVCVKHLFCLFPFCWRHGHVCLSPWLHGRGRTRPAQWLSTWHPCRRQEGCGQLGHLKTVPPTYRASGFPAQPPVPGWPVNQSGQVRPLQKPDILISMQNVLICELDEFQMKKHEQTADSPLGPAIASHMKCVGCGL